MVRFQPINLAPGNRWWVISWCFGVLLPSFYRTVVWDDAGVGVNGEWMILVGVIGYNAS